MTNGFKILSDASHIRKRFSMYGGSQVLQEETVFANSQFVKVQIVSGLLKTINEIIDNSVDEHVRTNGKYANKIDITIDNTGTITVSDNGRGIPAIQIDTPDGKEYQMEAAFTRARAGSNFDDTNRQSIGMNGVGSMITFVTSELFEAVSSDGKYEVTLLGKQGEKTLVAAKKSTSMGTTVKFKPDYKFFGLDTINDDHIKMIEERVKSLSLAFTNIKFKFNKKAINLKFNEYFGPCEIFQTERATFGITKSDGSFQTHSLVNGLSVKAGTHIDYFTNAVLGELKDVLQRRKKIDITLARLKQHVRVHCIINGFPALKFDSQTKERVTNSNAECRDAIGEFDVSKIVKKLMANQELIDEITAYTRLQEELAANKDLSKLEKTKKIKSDKYFAAVGKTNRIYVVEGDCLHEDTEIIRSDGTAVSLKNVKQGDCVISGDGKIETVIAKTQSIRQAVKIKTQHGEIISSRKHRLYVYNKLTCEFEFKEASEISLNPSNYQLVRSKVRTDTHYYEVLENANNILAIDGGAINYTNNDFFVVFNGTQLIRKHGTLITPGEFIVSVIDSTI